MAYRTFAPRRTSGFKPAVASAKIPFVRHPDSAEQLAIIDAALNTGKHLMEVARAGTGKTYTSVLTIHELLRRDPTERIVMCSFGKDISVEIGQKVPEGVVSGTLHSIMFGILKSHVDGRVMVDKFGDKVRNMLPQDMTEDRVSPIKKLVSLCKGSLLDGRDRDALLNLAAEHAIDLGDDPNEILRWIPGILAKCKDIRNVVDFDDMLWLPVVLGWGPAVKYTTGIVDEAQDLNNVQQEAMFMLAERIVVVGDDRQAIYAFRGADAQSMATLARRLAATPRGLITLPLTVTRRCDPVIVELAQTIVPDYQCEPVAWTAYQAWKAANPGAEPPAEFGHICRGVKYAQDGTPLPHEEPTIGSAVLCRTNAPLVSMAYALIRADVPAVILGRDFAEGLKGRIRKLVPAGSSSALLVKTTEEYRQKQTIQIQAANGGERVSAKLQTLNDQCDCIVALCEGMDTVTDVLNRVDRLFDDRSDPSRVVTLSSIHKAKGKEWDTVRIIRPDLIPHPMAKGDAARLQESNLEYVAYTRARHTLHIHD